MSWPAEPFGKPISLLRPGGSGATVGIGTVPPGGGGRDGLTLVSSPTKLGARWDLPLEPQALSVAAATDKTKMTTNLALTQSPPPELAPSQVTAAHQACKPRGSRVYWMSPSRPAATPACPRVLTPSFRMIADTW